MEAQESAGMNEPEQRLAIGGHFNHTFMWATLKRAGEACSPGPTGVLLAAIEKTYTNLESLVDKVLQTALTRQLPGWIWLCVNENEKILRIVTTNNEDNPMMYGILTAQYRPVLAIDLWEHAYFDQHNGDKETYIKAFFESVNWDKVSAIYEKLHGSGFKSLVSPLELF